MERKENLICGVKFCGGCNPRYDRGRTLEMIKGQFDGQIRFVNAEEGSAYDLLLVIGGCTNCCASYEQYQSRGDVLKIWDESQVESVFTSLENIINMED